jgi:hypothetical protein
VDDRGIDFILRLDKPVPEFLEIQVKTVRLTSSTYVFMRKKHFALHPNLYLALIILREGMEPDLYVISALNWLNPVAPFSSKDYAGLKSDPEFGLSISEKHLTGLEDFRFVHRINEFKSAATSRHLRKTA